MQNPPVLTSSRRLARSSPGLTTHDAPPDSVDRDAGRRRRLRHGDQGAAAGPARRRLFDHFRGGWGCPIRWKLSASSLRAPTPTPAGLGCTFTGLLRNTVPPWSGLPGAGPGMVARIVDSATPALKPGVGRHLAAPRRVQVVPVRAQRSDPHSSMCRCGVPRNSRCR